jgi:hypothetical protein
MFAAVQFQRGVCKKQEAPTEVPKINMVYTMQKIKATF